MIPFGLIISSFSLIKLIGFNFNSSNFVAWADWLSNLITIISPNPPKIIETRTSILFIISSLSSFIFILNLPSTTPWRDSILKPDSILISFKRGKYSVMGSFTISWSTPSILNLILYSSSPGSMWISPARIDKPLDKTYRTISLVETFSSFSFNLISSLPISFTSLVILFSTSTPLAKFWIIIFSYNSSK